MKNGLHSQNKYGANNDSDIRPGVHERLSAHWREGENIFIIEQVGVAQALNGATDSMRTACASTDSMTWRESA